MDEEQRRQRAIELLRQGRRPGDVLRELERSGSGGASSRSEHPHAGGIHLGCETRPKPQ